MKQLTPKYTKRESFSSPTKVGKEIEIEIMEEILLDDPIPTLGDDEFTMIEKSTLSEDDFEIMASQIPPAEPAAELDMEDAILVESLEEGFEDVEKGTPLTQAELAKLQQPPVQATPSVPAAGILYNGAKQACGILTSTALTIPVTNFVVRGVSEEVSKKFGGGILGKTAGYMAGVTSYRGIREACSANLHLAGASLVDIALVTREIATNPTKEGIKNAGSHIIAAVAEYHTATIVGIVVASCVATPVTMIAGPIVGSGAYALAKASLAYSGGANIAAHYAGYYAGKAAITVAIDPKGAAQYVGNCAQTLSNTAISAVSKAKDNIVSAPSSVCKTAYRFASKFFSASPVSAAI